LNFKILTFLFLKKSLAKHSNAHKIDSIQVFKYDWSQIFFTASKYHLPLKYSKLNFKRYNPSVFNYKISIFDHYIVLIQTKK